MRIEEIKQAVYGDLKVEEYIDINGFISRSKVVSDNAKTVADTLNRIKKSGVKKILWADTYSKIIKLTPQDLISFARSNKLPLKRENEDVILNMGKCKIFASSDTEELLSIIREVNAIKINGEKMMDIEDFARVIMRIDNISSIDKDIIKWLRGINRYELADKFENVFSTINDEKEIKKELLILTLKAVKKDLTT